MLLVMVMVLYPWPWLLVREGETLHYAFPGADGSVFTLRWRHSVELEDWEERFVVHGESILVDSTRFKTFGAGVPSHAGASTRLIDGWVEMDGIERIVDPLNVQAAAAEDYRLGYHGHVFALSHLGSHPILTFQVRREPLIAVLPALLRPWY